MLPYIWSVVRNPKPHIPSPQSQIPKQRLTTQPSCRRDGDVTPRRRSPKSVVCNPQCQISSPITRTDTYYQPSSRRDGDVTPGSWSPKSIVCNPQSQIPHPESPKQRPTTSQAVGATGTPGSRGPKSVVCNL